MDIPWIIPFGAGVFVGILAFLGFLILFTDEDEPEESIPRLGRPQHASNHQAPAPIPENEWIPWHGGPCPIPDALESTYEIMFSNPNRQGQIGRIDAKYFMEEWLHVAEKGRNIIAYRLIPSA